MDARCRAKTLILIAPILLAGCGRAIGPETTPTTSLQGRVHLDGRPAVRGWVEFIPIDGTIGRRRSAPIAADGSFVAEKVPVGRVAIQFAGPPPEKTGDPRMDRFLNLARRAPALHRDVNPGRNEPVELDLRRELAEFERAYPAAF